MTLMEQVQKQVQQLPPEQQRQVLDFAAFLHQRLAVSQPVRPRSLRRYAAFGSWCKRQIDALQYQQDLRSEWDLHPP